MRIINRKGREKNIPFGHKLHGVRAIEITITNDEVYEYLTHLRQQNDATDKFLRYVNNIFLGHFAYPINKSHVASIRNEPQS